MIRTQFRAILFGDPQPCDQKEVDYISRDVVSDLIGTDASFGVTLGDIVNDDCCLGMGLACIPERIGSWFGSIADGLYAFSNGPGNRVESCRLRVAG